MTPAASPLLVRSLICHAHVGMALTCLASFHRCSDRPVDLRLHDDGSLTAEDTAALLGAFPNARIIRRAEADALVLERLSGLPHCREFRKQYISALKMFDTLLLDPAPFLLLDTDVLFFQPFTNLEDPASAGKALVYMQDAIYAYTLSPWELATQRELRPVYRLNSGVMLVRGDRLDLAFVEHLLQRNPQFRRNWMVEQTIWGILARKYGALHWNSRQVTVVSQDFAPAPDQVAAHFVSPVRDRFAEFIPLPALGTPGRPVRVQREEAAPYHPLAAISDYVRNGVRNRLHLLRTAFHRPAKA